MSKGLFALSAIDLTTVSNTYNITGKYLELFEDESSSLSLEDMISGKFSFVPSSGEYEYARHAKSRYWLRFRVKTGQTSSRWVMEFPNHHTEEIIAFIPDQKGGYKSYKTGSSEKFQNRPFKSINFTFNLPSSEEEYTVYVCIKSASNAGFEINLKTFEYFTEYTTREYWFLGLFYGILCFIILYNGVLFLRNREYLYLSYALYLIGCALMAFSEDGLFFEFLWPDHPVLNRILFLKAEYLFLILFALYCAHFIELFKDSRKKAILVSCFILLLILFLEVWPYESGLWYSMVFCIPFLWLYDLAVAKLKTGYKAARAFLVGCTLVIASIILVRLRWYGIVPVNIFTVYIFNFSVVVEAFIFSYAIAERFSILKKEREAAQQKLIIQLEENKELQNKVNRELEGKVNERTRELSEEKSKLAEANSRLEAMAQELNKLNSKLDFENWHLQKDLKEEKKSRILLEKVSYEEFISIFPDDTACFRFLEKCKWEEGFRCLKCQNQRYIEKPEKPFVRRCTRCGYIESVTTHTLFHAVKFPLNKAFYLAYGTVYEKDSRTLDELSDMLELRRNTCWSFRKKVLERIETHQKKSGIEVRNWESIIVDDTSK